MNFFDTTLRRKILFASLYLSEGAPIGFLWLALPTRLRSSGVAVEQITWLTAVLVLPWTFKFVWAPLVDLLRTSRWTLRHWIVVAQCFMGATLVPLIWLDPVDQFHLLSLLLLTHAFAAATQDVAIDALCISTTDASERGQYNGWMQAGMLIGRALMGGGALVLATYVGQAAVVGLLIFLTTFSMVLVLLSKPPTRSTATSAEESHLAELGATLWIAVYDRNTWFGFAFAVTGGAAFKSLEVVYGPFLVDRNFDKETIGWFSLGPMIGAMIAGAIFGGWLADRVGHRRCVAGSSLLIAMTITALAVSDLQSNAARSSLLLVWLAATAFGIGMFTASSYTLFMDITHPAIAATQFSAFMGATNGCESWSSYVAGRIISEAGYPIAMLIMCLVSLLAIPLVVTLRPPANQQTGVSSE